MVVMTVNTRVNDKMKIPFTIVYLDAVHRDILLFISFRLSCPPSPFRSSRYSWSLFDALSIIHRSLCNLEANVVPAIGNTKQQFPLQCDTNCSTLATSSHVPLINHSSLHLHEPNDTWSLSLHFFCSNHFGYSAISLRQLVIIAPPPLTLIVSAVSMVDWRWRTCPSPFYWSRGLFLQPHFMHIHASLASRDALSQIWSSKKRPLILVRRSDFIITLEKYPPPLVGTVNRVETTASVTRAKEQWKQIINAHGCQLLMSRWLSNSAIS